MTMPTIPDDASDGDHLPAPVIDHKKAKAQLLSVLHRKDPMLCGAQAMQALTARNRELIHGDGKAIAEALADQVAILEAVSARFTFEALAARKPDHQKACASTALKANTTLTQALLALHRVSEDQRNGKAFNA
jgi:hypothetical protein